MRPAMPKRRRLLALTLAMGVAISMAVAGTGSSVAVAQAPLGDDLALTAAGLSKVGLDEVDPPAEEDAEETPGQGGSESGDPTGPGEGEATDPAEPDAEEAPSTPQAEESTPDAEPTPEESAEQETVEEDVTDAVSVVPDPMLVEAINWRLRTWHGMPDRPLDTPITAQDLGLVEFLTAYEVASLEGLQYATSLTGLRVSASPDLSDLTPLAGLEITGEISLSETGVRSVAPIARLPWWRLDVDTTPLESLVGFEGLDQIGELALSDTHVTDLSPLQGVRMESFLFHASERETPILDFTELSEMEGHVSSSLRVGEIYAWTPVTSGVTHVRPSTLPRGPQGGAFALLGPSELDLAERPRVDFDHIPEGDGENHAIHLYGTLAPRLWHQDPGVASAQQVFVGSEMQVQLRVADAEAPPAAGLTINGPDEGPVVTWSVVGELPEGLSLSQDGVISGTPTALTEGPVEVEVVATDAAGNASTRMYTFEVVEAPEAEIELGEDETPGGETPGEGQPGEQPGGQPGDQPGGGGAPDGATPPTGQGPDSAPKAVDAGWLPNTGGPAWWLTLAGLGTALAGGAVTWWARRRRLS